MSPQKARLKSLQFAALAEFTDTLIVSVSKRVVCHQPAGTNRDSPGFRTNRVALAWVKRGKRPRSGSSTSFTSDMLASIPARGYMKGDCSGGYTQNSFWP